jgi:hypothetical protein
MTSMIRRRMIRAACGVVSASLLGCGGGSLTAPSGGSGAPVIFSVTSFGRTLPISVGGQMISASGTHEIRLSAGTHTMNGSFSPSELVVPQLGISFIGHPLGGGGVRFGSVRSLTGPVLQTNPCSVRYSTPPGTTESQSFSIEFDVTTDENSACQRSL